MTNFWRAVCASLMLCLAAGATEASAERWPGNTASIGGAIAARVIAVKCTGPLKPAEIAELDAYIDEQQTAFMLESKANQRFGEGVFPRIARDYDFAFSKREACTTEARDMVTDMLARVRSAKTAENKAAGKQAHLKQ